MAQKIIMPKQGLQMTEGTIINWLKTEGEFIKLGEPLIEIETDKLTITIDSTAEGTMLKILRGVGDIVPVAETIAVVGAQGEDIGSFLGDTPQAAPVKAAVRPVSSATATTQAGKSDRALITPKAKTLAKERNVNYSKLAGSGPEGLIVERDIPIGAQNSATPLAKKIAQLEGVNMASLTGSGVRGKIYAADVRSSKPERERTENRIPMSSMRKIIAQRMTESLQERAQAAQRMKVDMSESVRMREQLEDAGNKLSFNDIILRCAAKALAEFPMMNASVEGAEIILKKYINIGIAVATSAGLLVPVLRDADCMTLSEIAEMSSLLVARAKDGKLSPDDLSGGTFTISNLGMYGVDSFTAIINPPESAILAVGKVSKQPAVVDDELCIRPMMELTLTFDHRIVDGAPAAMFLRRIKNLLESPYLML